MSLTPDLCALVSPCVTLPLQKARAAADAEEGRWLLAAQRAAVHVHLGYSNFAEYVERLFGYKPRSTQEKLRVAEALESVPALAHALESGELNWSAVRELTRAAVRETEHEWLEFARGKTVRQLEQVLAGKQLGDTPSSPPDPAALRHVLRFEVAAETFALFRDALDELRRRAGAALDDDSTLLELARSVLGGPREEGCASYQVVLNLCPACGRGQQQASGGLVAVDADITRMAHCDCQHLGPSLDQNPTPANDLQPHDSRIEQESQTAHVGAVPPASARVPRRSQQAIPPALRRAVLLRDQRHCQVPGCHNATWLDLHHLELRSEDGPHSAENLISICGAHHRAAHRGKLILDRTAGGALRVRHADGTEYGHRVTPRVLEIQAKVFSGLRNLGFREAQVRSALQQLQQESSSVQASFADLLREALARLRCSGVRR